MASNDEKIILNVGGIRYETNRSTLTKYPDTYLGTIFGEGYKEINRPNEENQYFLDRNGYAFRYILEYHRTGQILWTSSNETGYCCNGVSLKEMILEFEFFQIPNKLKELKDQQDHDEKEYDLNEIRELFKEMSITTFPSTTSDDSKIETNIDPPTNNPPTNNPPNVTTVYNDDRNFDPKFATTNPQYSYYPQPSNSGAPNNNYLSNNNNNNNKVVRIRRMATIEEHVQILDSFIIALSDVIYEIHHNLRRQISIYFHSRLPTFENPEKHGHHESSSIECDLDLDSVKEIMKPFRASGFKLLELYGNEIERKLKRDFNETISFKKTSQSANTILITITILTQINHQYIFAKSSLVRSIY